MAWRRADPEGMEVTCPVCDADIPVAGDEKAGEEVFCAFCRAPLTVRLGQNDELELEDDY